MANARIMIVEDEFLVAANLEAVLEDLGYQTVGIAPDYDTALRLADTKPDVALVDIHLRDGETGPTIAERLCRDHNVTVLFVTANPRMACRKAPGVIGVLDKPCEDELIAAAIDYALEARRGRKVSPPPGLTLLDAA